MCATNYSDGIKPGNKTITALFEAEYRGRRRAQNQPGHRDRETRQQHSRQPQARGADGLVFAQQMRGLCAGEHGPDEVVAGKYARYLAS